MSRTPEEVIDMARRWMGTTFARWTPAMRECAEKLDNDKLSNIDKLTAVLEFAEQSRKPPRALLLWIAEAIEQENTLSDAFERTQP